MRTQKLMLHRLIVIWVVMSMLIVQASPALAVVQQAVIDIQEQLSGVFALPPTAYTPTAPLTIDDRIYPVQEEFPVVIPSPTPIPSATPIYTPTPTATAIPVNPVGSRVHATRILDDYGPINNKKEILGAPNTTVNEYNEAVMYDNSCIVVGFDGVVAMPEHIFLWIRGIYYNGPANMARVTVQYSDQYLSCEDTRWQSFPRWQSSVIEGRGHPHGNYPHTNGALPRQVWWDTQVPLFNWSVPAIRSIRIVTQGRFAPIDSVTIVDGTFTFEQFGGLENPPR